MENLCRVASFASALALLLSPSVAIGQSAAVDEARPTTIQYTNTDVLTGAAILDGTIWPAGEPPPTHTPNS
jgi:hypothetical protein